MKHFLCTLFFCISSICVHSQILQRQTFSLQGASKTTNDGVLVSQSLGQASLAGTFTSKDLIVQQGFQQTMLSKYLENAKVNEIKFNVVVFPNPVISELYIKFSEVITSDVEIILWDILGKPVLNLRKEIVDGTIYINNLYSLPSGNYIVTLKTDLGTQSFKIIKN